MLDRLARTLPISSLLPFEHIPSRIPAEVELVSCRDFLKQGSKESLVRVLLNPNDFVTVR